MQVSAEDKKWALLCYIPLFNFPFFILGAVKKVDNEYVLFHVRQGIVLFALTFAVLLVSIISGTLGLMLWGVNLLLHGAAAYGASQGQMMKIPVIADLALQIPKYYLFEKLTGKAPGDEELGEKPLDKSENNDNLNDANKNQQ